MNEFIFFIQNIMDVVKEVFLDKNIGDFVELDVFNLEVGIIDDYVCKYFLGFEEDDDWEVENMFFLMIDKISCNVFVKLGKEFYEQVFGEGDVSNKIEVLVKIQEDYNGFYFK